ncbi:MAG: ABC transporter permease [Bacilli bacterium]|jgi:putative ABC transport system permease protein|nr:ABC transporter permease [Acholeplasmataceae bacterium]
METISYILIDALRFGFPYSLLALGIFITYRVLDFPDLTAEGSFTLGGAVGIVLILAGVNPWVATLLAALSGAIAGMITGILYTKCKIPGLLSSIITMTGLYSINMFIMGFQKGNTSGYDTVARLGENKSLFQSFIQFFSKPNYNIILISLLIVIIIVIIIYWFFGTELGMSIRATGMNSKMARAQGINSTFMIILGLAIANMLIAMGGSLTAQINRTADINLGVGTLVVGLSSIIIGEAVFGKRTFKNWLISVVLGTIIYYVIINSAIQLGLPNYLKRLLYAVLITVVLIIPLIKKALNKKEGNNARVKKHYQNL